MFVPWWAGLMLLVFALGRPALAILAALYEADDDSPRDKIGFPMHDASREEDAAYED